MADAAPPEGPQALPAALRAWLGRLDAEFLERAVPVRLALLAILSRSHVLLLGPPGTAKSLLARRACESLQGGNYFATLLTKFSAPEDVFGPLSLPELERGTYRRLTTRFLPWAHVAFLDEVYKANASILNALLTVLNERIYYNGEQRVDLPLRSVIAASNEVPEQDQGLEALDDRLLLRTVVDSIQDDAAFVKLLTRGPGGERQVGGVLTPAVLAAFDRDAERVRLGDAAVEGLRLARRFARDAKLDVSDRRWVQLTVALRAMAAADGLPEVMPAHLNVLRFGLWRDPKDRAKADEILSKVVDELRPPGSTATRQELLDMLKDLHTQMERAQGSRGYYARSSTSHAEVLTKARNTLVTVRETIRTQASAMQREGSLWNAFGTGRRGGHALEEPWRQVQGHALVAEARQDGQYSSILQDWPESIE